MDNQVQATKAHFSIPSIIAIVAAIVSFSVGAFWGFILALIAIFFGIIGMVLALSSSVRGGMVSILSVIAAVAGIIVAAIKAIAWLF
jgi:hypothetical protein